MSEDILSGVEKYINNIANLVITKCQEADIKNLSHCDCCGKERQGNGGKVERFHPLRNPEFKSDGMVLSFTYRPAYWICEECFERVQSIALPEENEENSDE